MTTSLNELIDWVTDKEIEMKIHIWLDAHAWGNARFNREAVSMMDFVKELEDEPGADGYTAWVYTLVQTRNHEAPKFLLLQFLHEVLWSSIPFHDLGFLYGKSNSKDRVQQLADRVTEAMARELNKRKASDMPGRYKVGYHEADGSLGILYCEA